jgi:hypothetical protein
MFNVLSTGNVGLFFNILPYVQANIFPSPCHGVSSAGPIYPVVGSNIMKKKIQNEIINCEKNKI